MCACLFVTLLYVIVGNLVGNAIIGILTVRKWGLYLILIKYETRLTCRGRQRGSVTNKWLRQMFINVCRSETNYLCAEWKRAAPNAKFKGPNQYDASEIKQISECVRRSLEPLLIWLLRFYWVYVTYVSANEHRTGMTKYLLLSGSEI